MAPFIVISLVLSVVLTLVANVAIRMFPGIRHWFDRQVDGRLNAPTERSPETRVYFPWRAMLIGSIVLTIIVNIGLALWRS